MQRQVEASSHNVSHCCDGISTVRQKAPGTAAMCAARCNSLKGLHPFCSCLCAYDWTNQCAPAQMRHPDCVAAPCAIWRPALRQWAAWPSSSLANIMFLGWQARTARATARCPAAGWRVLPPADSRRVRMIHKLPSASRSLMRRRPSRFPQEFKVLTQNDVAVCEVLWALPGQGPCSRSRRHLERQSRCRKQQMRCGRSS